MTVTKFTFWPGCKVPDFSASCIYRENVTDISLKSFEGFPVILFFYPFDFDPLSSTELDALEELEETDCKVLAISNGSLLSKKKYLSAAKEVGGGRGKGLHMVEDTDGQIAKLYGVQREEGGYSYRALIVVNREGEIELRNVCDLPLGLRIKDIVETVKEKFGIHQENGRGENDTDRGEVGDRDKDENKKKLAGSIMCECELFGLF